MRYVYCIIYWGFSFCIHLDLCCNNKLNFGTSECICNETGSISDYCSEETGKCQCKTGFTGDKCDACATGYINCMETDACNDYDKMQCDYIKGFIRYPDDTYYHNKFGKDRKGRKSFTFDAIILHSVVIIYFIPNMPI